MPIRHPLPTNTRMASSMSRARFKRSLRSFSICAFIAGISNLSPAHADRLLGEATLPAPKSAEVLAFANYPVSHVARFPAGKSREEAENEPSDPKFTLQRSDLTRFLETGKLTNV